MARTLTALVLGTLIGVGATLLLAPDGRSRPPLGAESFFPASASRQASPAPAVVVDRDFYRQLADADGRELEAMMTRTAAEPPSSDRDFALAMLVRRYAELDPPRAAELAREAGVGGAALAAAYGAWAEREPAEALAALERIEDPEHAADAAVALIVALGNDAEAFGRVAGVLAAREPATPAGTQSVVPMIAPGGPAAFGPSSSALALAADRWAVLDPRRALATARELADERVRLPLEAAALRALARVAPDAAFAALAASRMEPLQFGMLVGTVLELARAEPARVLAAADRWSPELRRIAQSAALQRLAEQDPRKAADYLERLPMGMERQGLAQLVARNYGMRDAAAALAWARGQPERQNLVAAVIGGVAEQDARRALDLALELPPAERMHALPRVVMTTVQGSDAAAEAILGRVLTVDDPQVRELVVMTALSAWAWRSPERAIGWLLTNGHDVPPHAFQNLGQQIASRDPRMAVRYESQIPAAARGPFLEGAAAGYAQSDPQGAIEWLRQFRGEPWYEQAAVAVAMTAAQNDGAAAARLVDELQESGTGTQTQHVANHVAVNWANRDPAAAADWATNRPTEQERAAVIQGVLSVWSSQNFEAARQWTLRQPQHAIRDGALTVLLTTTANLPNGLDAGLLSAFASDAARQQAVFQAVQVMAQRDPASARATANAYLTNPALRAAAERALQTARDNPGPSQIDLIVTQ